MIKKPQRQFKKTEESQGQKDAKERSACCFHSQLPEPSYPSNYSLSFLSFSFHPSTIKLCSGTTDISVAGLSSWRVREKLFVPEPIATQIFHVEES